MLIIPKKNFPPDLNPLGLKRGDVVEIEVSDATQDYITLDPVTLKLNALRNPHEQREPLVKQHKPKNAAQLPLPDLKSMIQPQPHMPAPAAPSTNAPVHPIK